MQTTEKVVYTAGDTMLEALQNFQLGERASLNVVALKFERRPGLARGFKVTLTSTQSERTHAERRLPESEVRAYEVKRLQENRAEIVARLNRIDARLVELGAPL